MFSVSSFTTLALLFLTHNPILTYSTTLDSDIEVLQSFRQSIDPNTISSTSFLNTWNFNFDPCESQGPHFLGIICSIPEDNNDNSTYRITTINLEGEGLEGFLTPIIGNLTELTYLNLRRNKFRGPIPDSIVNITKITRLLLSENFLSGSIPFGFQGLKRLEILDLSQNGLSGSIPPSISEIRSLLHLSLSNNEFSGTIPDLTTAWQLEFLDLRSNHLSGNLPDLPKNLRQLSLAHNLLTGHISPVSKLKRLTTLDLSDNRLSESINKGVLTLPELIRANFSNNKFTEIEVVKIGNNRMSQLRAIEAQNNKIRSHLPLNLITYESLRDVNLGHNMFFGGIPVEYWDKMIRGEWRTLFLDYNLLEGNVPIGLVHSRGSIAHNCVTNCKSNIPMCHGGQRPPSQCVN